MEGDQRSVSPGGGPLAADRPHLDSLDVRVAAALQVNGRASWRELAGMVGTSESTAARRARALHEAGLIQTTVLAEPIRCGLGYPVLLQVSCQPERIGEVGGTLAARDDVRAVMIVTGMFDLVVELIVPSSRYLADVLVNSIARTPGLTRLSTVAVLRQFKSTVDWSRQQFIPHNDGTRGAGLAGARETGPVTLDEVDLALLGELRDDGRRSYADLAGRLGMSESAVRRRIERLTESGCLQPVTLVDPGLLGLEIETFIWLGVELSRLDAVAEALTERPEVRYLAAASGVSDLVVEATLASQDDLYRFRTEVLGTIPGIRSAESALQLRTLKRAFLRFETADGPQGRSAGPEGRRPGGPDPERPT